MIRLAEVFAAGIVAAYVMFLVNWLAYRYGLVKVSVVEAFNDFQSRFHSDWLSEHVPFHIPRTITRLLVGGLFALLYSAFVATLPSHTPWTIMTLCIVLGFVHGFGVGTMDAILVAEGHAASTYRQFGHQVIGTHLISHVVYGLSLGVLFTLMG